MIRLGVIVLSIVLLAGCSGGQSGHQEDEDREAKKLFQGVWLDTDNGDVSIRVQGDTIFYADTTSMPAYFKIVHDSLVPASGTTYGIVKQTPHLFWFSNPPILIF